MKYYSKQIESNMVLWFEETNRYVVLEPLFYEVFKSYNENTVDNAQSYLAKKFKLNKDELRDSYSSYKVFIDQITGIEQSNTTSHKPIDINTWAYTFHYKVYGTNLKLRFSDNLAKELIHPKFAHLLVNVDTNYSHSIDIIHHNGLLFLILNNKHVGSWSLNERHLFQGKFAVILLNLTSNKCDKDWMAVLHASAVYKENKTIVFLGESGSGKSTATTLLTLQGYNLLADDFVPLEATTKQIYSFPAAISVKEQLLAQMEESFPQLKTTSLRRKDSKTQYKYLYPEVEKDRSISLVANALVFIKYVEAAKTSLKPLSASEVLELLIPDSWISPSAQHIPLFLDWIEQVPAYTLAYSDNREFFDIMDKL